MTACSVMMLGINGVLMLSENIVTQGAFALGVAVVVAAATDWTVQVVHALLRVQKIKLLTIYIYAVLVICVGGFMPWPLANNLTLLIVSFSPLPWCEG